MSSIHKVKSFGLFIILVILNHVGIAQAYLTVEAGEEKAKLVYTSDYLFNTVLSLENDKKTKISVDDAFTAILKIGDKEFPLFFEKHDDFVVKFDGEQIKFERHGAANNTFFQIYSEQAQKDQAYKEKSLDAVEIKAFDFRDQMKKLMKDYPKYDFVTSRFKEFLKVENEFRYQKSLFKHGIIRKRAHRIPEEMIPAFDLTGYADKEKMISPSYREFLFYFSAFQAMRDNGFEEVSNVTGMYVLHSYWVNQRLEDLSVYNLDYELLKRYAPDMDPVILYNRMQAYDDDKGASIEKIKTITSKYAKKQEEREEKPEKGVSGTNQDLVAVDLKGKEVRLSDFDKKIVYIDIWASWCGPCRREFQSAPKLKEGLSKKAKKKIVFLYISIDEDQNKWKKTVDKLSLEGVHWNSKGGWGSDVVRMFGISGIPRYVIIKEGKVVNSEAPRPSNPKTIGILNNLAR